MILQKSLGSRKDKARVCSISSDEGIACQLQSEQYNEWLFIAMDANSPNLLVVTDTAYLDALIATDQYIYAQVFAGKDAVFLSTCQRCS